MDTAERLTFALNEAGYDGPAPFAQKHGFVESTVRSHANGTRSLTVRAAKQYEAHLKQTWQWLAYGDEGKLIEAKKRESPVQAGLSSLMEFTADEAAKAIDAAQFVDEELRQDLLKRLKTLAYETASRSVRSGVSEEEVRRLIPAVCSAGIDILLEILRLLS